MLWTQNYTSPLAPQVPNEYRPLTIREICLFPRFPQTMPYHMTYYGVNALELTTQIPDFKWVNMKDLPLYFLIIIKIIIQSSTFELFFNFGFRDVIKVESILQPWRENSHHHKKLWRALYSQRAQDSSPKTEFVTKVAHNSEVTM